MERHSWRNFVAIPQMWKATVYLQLMVLLCFCMGDIVLELISYEKLSLLCQNRYPTDWLQLSQSPCGPPGSSSVACTRKSCIHCDEAVSLSAPEKHHFLLWRYMVPSNHALSKSCNAHPNWRVPVVGRSHHLHFEQPFLLGWLRYKEVEFEHCTGFGTESSWQACPSFSELQFSQIQNFVAVSLWACTTLLYTQQHLQLRLVVLQILSHLVRYASHLDLEGVLLLLIARLYCDNRMNVVLFGDTRHSLLSLARGRHLGGLLLWSMYPRRRLSWSWRRYHSICSGVVSTLCLLDRVPVLRCCLCGALSMYIADHPCSFAAGG